METLTKEEQEQITEIKNTKKIIELIIDSLSDKKTYSRYSQSATKDEMQESYDELIDKMTQGYIHDEIFVYLLDTSSYSILDYSKMTAEIARTQEIKPIDELRSLSFFQDYLYSMIKADSPWDTPKDGMTIETQKVDGNKGAWGLSIQHQTKTKNNKDAKTFIKDGIELTEDSHPAFYL